jgi:hypothetical protein
MAKDLAIILNNGQHQQCCDHGIAGAEVPTILVWAELSPAQDQDRASGRRTTCRWRTSSPTASTHAGDAVGGSGAAARAAGTHRQRSANAGVTCAPGDRTAPLSRGRARFAAITAPRPSTWVMRVGGQGDELATRRSTSRSGTSCSNFPAPNPSSKSSPHCSNWSRGRWWTSDSRFRTIRSHLEL